MKAIITLTFVMAIILAEAQSTAVEHLSLDDAVKKMQENNKAFAVAMTHGTMRTLVYSPTEKDDQNPHEQDEVYIIVSGSGVFQNGNEKYSFKPNDVIFVPAKREHRFIEFTEDFKTWVIFYGPKGGEQ